MRCARPLILLVFLLLAFAGRPSLAATAAPAQATGGTAPAPSGLTSAEAQQLLSVLQDPQKRAQLITTLQNLEKVAPPTAAAAPAKPAASAPASPAAPSHEVSLKPHSLGADIVTGAGGLLGEVDMSLGPTIRHLTDYRGLIRWADQVSSDPTMLSSVLNAIWRLAVVLIVAFVFEYVAWRFVSPFYNRLGLQARKAEAEAEAEAPPSDSAGTPADRPGRERSVRQRFNRPLQSGWGVLRRLPHILLAMALDALPPLAFLVAGLLVLATPIGGDWLIRLTITAVVNAYVLVRLLLVVARGTFCAPSSKLRLLHVSNEAAAFLTLWCRRIALVGFLGYVVIRIGNLSGMSIGVQHGLGRLFGLAIHIMLIIMVLKRRREVESWLRGQAGEHSFWTDLKHRMASVWHIQAIVLIVLVWIVYAAEVGRGVGHPLHLILMTMGLLILFRILSIIILGALDKVFAIGREAEAGTRYALIGTRAMRYHAPLRSLVNIALAVIFVLALLQIWGIDAWAWFEVGGLGGRVLSSLGTILVTLIVAVIVWETINFVMQIYMDDLSQQGAYVRVARLRTVVPVLRNTLLIALLVVIVLTALSEIGVNIAPLLAGAGIIGVAIGFGSQKLVQDFITGIFLLLENAMQVGDWVTAAGLSGSVENLSIRTLRLRAGDGSVHIIPFSSVSTVTNTNRGLGNAAVSVTISYEEDTDAVAEILKQIALDMRKEDAFKSGMLSDLQFWGVDRVDGTTATLAGQIVCTDSGRWAVQREYNRRVKLAFQEKGIRMMPSASIMGFQHPLDVRVELPETAARRDEGPKTIEGETGPAEKDAEEASRPRRASGSGS